MLLPARGPSGVKPESGISGPRLACLRIRRQQRQHIAVAQATTTTTTTPIKILIAGLISIVSPPVAGGSVLNLYSVNVSESLTVIVVAVSASTVGTTPGAAEVVVASKTDRGTSSMGITVLLSKQRSMGGPVSPGQMYVPQAPREDVRQHPVREPMSTQCPWCKAW